MSSLDSADSALWAAYRATVYVAVVDVQRLAIHIDHKCPALDALLQRRGLTHWAFITAWNPRSQPLPRADNDMRHEQLKEDVRRLGLEAFEGQGEPADLNWAAERSLLAIGISVVDAVRLGRQYEQVAILVGEIGGEAKLLRCAQGA